MAAGKAQQAGDGVRVDLTPPVTRIQSPTRDARYLLRQPVRADWWAFDRLSGLESAEASAPSGEPLDTGTPGFHTLWVFARDRAGNTARVEVDYQVICIVETVLPSGFFLDRLLPPEERVMAGRFRCGLGILSVSRSLSPFGSRIASAR
ncbi:MAG: hypothetical protein ABDI20_05630 [Candidatus Bipolaricaulaceae bacterium]